MIKYVNFKGQSFNSESEYNESMNELLNQPLKKFESRTDLQNFIDEFFKPPFSNTWRNRIGFLLQWLQNKILFINI